MSTSPAPRDSSDRPRAPSLAAAMWEAAQAERSVSDECRRRDAFLESLPESTGRREYWWRSERFEAHFELFYQSSSAPTPAREIVGLRLLGIDYVTPSPRRRIEIEDQFRDRLREAGPLYEHVQSWLHG